MTDAPAEKPAKPHLPDAQTVTQVTHWTDRLFSFRVTRPGPCASARANS
jgi:ferredoxin--NADP+ reductase